MDRLHLLRSRCLPALVAALLALPLLGPAEAHAVQETAPPPERETVTETLSEFRPNFLEVEESRNLATTPASVAELMELEARIRDVVQRVLPATVGLSIGRSQGSGVIISPDGYVLTAAHVSGQPGARVTIIMPDGMRYRGVSLGVNREIDDGLVKITDPRATDLPWVPLGSARELPLGTWTVALGHPGGYQRERPPVVRVGRILANNEDFVMTDNTLVGGDSGGPLFDLDGRVIGIHSRIGGGTVNNIHVPSDRFLEDWVELAASERIGGTPRWQRAIMRATDGLETDPVDVGDEGARVVGLIPDGPAHKAGLRINDRIIAIGGDKVQNGQDFMLRRLRLRPGQAVTYTIRRDDEVLEVEVIPVAPGDLQTSNVRRSGGMLTLRPVLPERSRSQSVIGMMLSRVHMHPGARIASIHEGGPAEAAGLQVDDVIISLDGCFVRSESEYSSFLRIRAPGDIVRLGVLREGQLLDIEIMLREWSEVYETD